MTLHSIFMQVLYSEFELEMVDIRSRFGLNCIKTYVNCTSVQLFINSNTIP
jgi:hypothetical protein